MRITNYLTQQQATLAVAFCCVCLFSMAVWNVAAKTADDAQPVALAYLANADQDERPTTEQVEHFGCDNKIYAVAELENYPLGKYEFSVRWIDPSGTTREHTRYPFHVHNKKTRLWSWLSLQRGAGAGMFRWLDPSAGLEDFIGRWQIEVQISNKRIATLEMEVHC